MGNYLQGALSSLYTSLQAAGGVPVTYFYDDYEVNMIAVKGDSEFAVDIDGAVYTNFRMVDWIIKSTDLVVAGVEVEPEQGNTIQEGDKVYEIAPGDNLKPWEWVDTHRTMIRVHTLLRESYEEGY